MRRPTTRRCDSESMFRNWQRFRQRPSFSVQNRMRPSKVNIQGFFSSLRSTNIGFGSPSSFIPSLKSTNIGFGSKILSWDRPAFRIEWGRRPRGRRPRNASSNDRPVSSVQRMKRPKWTSRIVFSHHWGQPILALVLHQVSSHHWSPPTLVLVSRFYHG